MKSMEDGPKRLIPKRESPEVTLDANKKPKTENAVATSVKEKPKRETKRDSQEKPSQENKKSSQLKILKEKIHELNERYGFEMEKEAKANLGNQLEKAQKEYRKLEEDLDTNGDGELEMVPETEAEKMARLKTLRELVRDLNEKYGFEMEKEAKANLWNQLEKAQKELRKLEEELDTQGDKKKEETKDLEEKEGLIIILIDLLEKAKVGDAISIKILIEFVATHRIEITIIGPRPTPEEIERQRILIVLLGRIRSGDITVIDQLIQIITIDVITITDTDPTLPPATPEVIVPLDELRDLYLKAKRLRGNVFRGGIMGRMFGRKLNFGRQEMDFGGNDGKRELERVRTEYQEGLTRYRSTELTRLQNDLSTRLSTGVITPAEANALMQGRVVGLLSEEQGNIDGKIESGIERNIFEKMKEKWRQSSGKRLIAGIGLFGVGALTGGTAIGAGIVGTRAVMGGVGTYVGVESGLERYSKLIGHKGLVDKITKEIGNSISPTTTLYNRHIMNLPPEDIRKEAARLRMLQVEKGLSINNMDNVRRVAAMIIIRDNELTAQEAMSGAHLENPALSFADRLSTRLGREINLRNEAVESEVDRERIKKMIRKTTAVLAGGAVGWLIGGKLFHKPEIAPPVHTTPVPPHVEATPTFEHIGVKGDRLWKIIEHDMDSRGLTSGMSEGVKTDVLKILNNTFDHMSPAHLKELGFSSGDIDVIKAGDVLHLGEVLGNPETVTKALLHAQNISPAEIAVNVRNNATILKWFLGHHKELKEVFDAKLVDEILRGVR